MKQLILLLWCDALIFKLKNKTVDVENESDPCTDVYFHGYLSFRSVRSGRFSEPCPCSCPVVNKHMCEAKQWCSTTTVSLTNIISHPVLVLHFPFLLHFSPPLPADWLAWKLWLWSSGCVNNSKNQEWGHTPTTDHRTGWTGFHKHFLWLTPLIDFSLISVSDYAAGESCVCVQSGCVHIFSLHILFLSIQYLCYCARLQSLPTYLKCLLFF